MLAAGLAAYPVVQAGALGRAVLLLAVLAMVCVVAAVVLWGRLAGVALFLLAAEYVVVEATSRVGPLSIVVYAVGLIVLFELLLWSAELPRRAVVDRAVATHRVLSLGLIASAAALLALVALAAAGLSLGGAYRGALIGVVAAVLLIGSPWVLVRGRTRRS